MKQRSIPAPFVFIAIFVIALILLALNFPKNSPSKPTTLSPISTPVSGVIKNQTDVPSADGTHVLTIKREQTRDNSVAYTFITTDAGAKEQTIFTKTVNSTSSMMIPQNSWSPDNRYVFIKILGAAGAQYLVFKATGEAFGKDQQYIDVSSLFLTEEPKYILKEITGWDGINLLHVTSTSGPAKGPNFWFDVTSQNFLQLY